MVLGNLSYGPLDCLPLHNKLDLLPNDWGAPFLVGRHVVIARLLSAPHHYLPRCKGHYFPSDGSFFDYLISNTRVGGKRLKARSFSNACGKVDSSEGQTADCYRDHYACQSLAHSRPYHSARCGAAKLEAGLMGGILRQDTHVLGAKAPISRMGLG
jgi:hypothetical protein